MGFQEYSLPQISPANLDWYPMSLDPKVIKRAIRTQAREDASVQHELRRVRRSMVSLFVRSVWGVGTLFLAALLAWFVLHSYVQFNTRYTANARVKDEAEEAWHGNSCAHGHSSVVPCEEWDEKRKMNVVVQSAEEAASHMMEHFWFFHFSGCGERCTIWVTALISSFSWSFMFIPIIAVFILVFYSQEVIAWLIKRFRDHKEVKSSYEGTLSRTTNGLDRTGMLIGENNHDD